MDDASGPNTDVTPVAAAVTGNIVTQVYNSGTSLMMSTFDSSTQSTVALTTITIATGSRLFIFDICYLDSSHVMVVWSDPSTPTTIRVQAYLVTASAITPTQARDITVVAGVTALACNYDPPSKYNGVIWATSSGGFTGTNSIYARVCFDVGLSVIVAPALVQAGVTNVLGLGIGFNAVSGAVCVVEADAPSAGSHGCFTTILNPATGAVVSGPAKLYHAQIVTKPWVYAGTVYCCVREGISDPTPSFVSSAVGPVCVMALTAGGYNVAKWHLQGACASRDAMNQNTITAIQSWPRPPVLALPSDAKTFTTAIPCLNFASAISTVSTTGLIYVGGADELRISYDETQGGQWTRATANDLACLSSGVATVYDGARCFEAGYVRTPTITGNTTAPTGGNMSNGTYEYVAYFEQVDALGNTHVSGYSAPYVVTLAGGSTTQAVTLTINTLGITNREGLSDRKLNIRIARTKLTGLAPHYLVTVRGAASGAGSQPSPYNDPTVFSVTFTDGFSDLQLSFGLGANEGNILPPELPPPMKFITSHKNRLWGVSAEDERTVWYTRNFIKGEAPAWSSFLTIRMDETPDPIVALGQLDDKLLVFTGSRARGTGRVYWLSGDGFNDFGGGQPFAGPFLLQSDTGCVDPGSLLAIDDGVLFAGKGGIYMVTRALDIQFVGLPVEDTTTITFDTCLSAVLDAFNKRAYFLYTDSKGFAAPNAIVCYDYSFKFWSVWKWTVQNPIKAQTLYRGLHAIGNATSVSLATTGATPGLDPGPTWAPLRIETPWMRVGSLNGFQRIYSIVIEGTQNSPCTLFAYLYYDFSPSYSELHTIDLSAASTVTGLPVIRYIIKVAKQKCSTIKIMLVDSGLTSETSSLVGFDLAGLTLKVGMKPGSPKLPSVNKG